MKELLGKLVVGALPGLVATAIALAVVWGYYGEHLTGGAHVHTSQEAGTPCEARPCYAKLNNRMVKIETQLNERTDKRYRSTDAARDQAAQREYIDSKNKILRDDMAALRRELNDRIDKMHMEK